MNAHPPAQAPETAAQIGNEDADLDRQWAGKGLRDCNRVPHLFLGQPAPLTDQFLFHQPAERDRPAKAERTEA
jgi:hypothetical protein